MLSTELQIIILAAGRGSRMTQLLGTAVPKCLLPVAGNPLIYYPLKFLAQNGFQGNEVLVIIQQENGEQIGRDIVKIGESVGVPVDLFLVDEESENFGTAESIRLAFNAKKITGDVLLLSCDILTNSPLSSLLNFHRTYDSDCTVYFAENLPLPGSKLPGPKNRLKQERDIVGLKPSTSELMFMCSEADFEDELSLPVSVLKRCPHVKVFTALTDAHIYVFKKRVIEKLAEDKAHSNIKGEFLPSLIKKQFDVNDSIGSSEKMSFYVFMQPESQCIRVNSVPNYSIANKSLDWLVSSFYENKESWRGPKGKDTTIEKSCRIVSSVLGDNCKIGEKVKITNSIILDEVEIETGSTVENCIISSYAKIGPNSALSACLVGPKYHVSDAGRYTNEYLSVMEENLF